MLIKCLFINQNIHREILTTNGVFLVLLFQTGYFVRNSLSISNKCNIYTYKSYSVKKHFIKAFRIEDYDIGIFLCVSLYSFIYNSMLYIHEIIFLVIISIYNYMEYICFNLYHFTPFNNQIETTIHYFKEIIYIWLL